MDTIILNAAIWWLIAGTLLVLLEVTAIPGIGLLFAGLAAITVGGLVSSNVISEADTTIQFIGFFLLTGVWAASLWIPMKRLRYKTSSGTYQNVVGDIAIVQGAPLSKHGFGQVKWSGTVLKARIAEDCSVTSIPEGSEVIIVAVDGAKVYVKPR